MKNQSKIHYFLFEKKHAVIGDNTLFHFQSDLAKFATTVQGCNFYKKSPEGIRPFLSQQLKISNEVNSKPIKNHKKTYLLIVKERAKKINPDLENSSDIEKFLTEFSEWFSKDPIEALPRNLVLFDEITANLLGQLQIVAVANGGSLTEKEFLHALKNLKQS